MFNFNQFRFTFAHEESLYHRSLLQESGVQVISESIDQYFTELCVVCSIQLKMVTPIIVTVNCMINVPLMLLSIAGNVIVLATVFKTPSLHSPSYLLLSGLAVSDLGVGLLVQPFYIAEKLSSTEFLRNLMTTMGFAFCGVSFGTMALISVDRYLALLYHLEYRSRVTTYRVVITMSFVWFLHFILLNRFWVPPKYIYIGFALLLIYITVATVSYLQIYRIVRRHQLQIQNQNQAVLSQSNSLSQKRSATNTLVFYVSAVICYFPWCVYRIAHGDIFVANINTAWIFTTSLVFANSAINPFLYGWRLRELRNEVKKTMKKTLRISQTEQTQTSCSFIPFYKESIKLPLFFNSVLNHCK